MFDVLTGYFLLVRDREECIYLYVGLVKRRRKKRKAILKIQRVDGKK